MRLSHLSPETYSQMLLSEITAIHHAGTGFWVDKALAPSASERLNILL